MVGSVCKGGGDGALESTKTKPCPSSHEVPEEWSEYCHERRILFPMTQELSSTTRIESLTASISDGLVDSGG